jgi:ATP-dependent Clp protease ATP-binding subunit ClpX
MSWKPFRDLRSELDENVRKLYGYGTFDYPFQRDGVVTDTQCVLLPIENVDGHACGVFRIDGRLMVRPIGFMFEGPVIHRVFYRMDTKGLLQQVEYNDKRLFFPIDIIPELKVKIGDAEQFVYGVRVQGQMIPILLTYRSRRGGANIHGICTDKKGKFMVFRSSNFERRSTAEERIHEIYRGELKTIFSSGEDLKDKATEIFEDGDVEIAHNFTSGEITSPQDIVNFLDQYVVGQDRAKRVLAVTVWKFLMRRLSGNESVKKSNLMFVGPTGVGKTYMLKLLEKALQIPMFATEMTGKSSTGYIGESPVTIFHLVRKANPDDEAPYVIVFFDEIDKLARDSWGGGGGFGTRIMNELVGWIESATISEMVDEERKPLPPISTKNMMFIFAGAFMGDGDENSLTSIIAKRLKLGEKTIGFRTDETEALDGKLTDAELLERLVQDDLIKYGMKPEFVARVPSVVTLSPLTRDDLLSILLTKKRSIISTYHFYVRARGFELNIEDEALGLIADRANAKSGARSLETVFEALFANILYDPDAYAEDRVITITPEVVERELRFF